MKTAKLILGISLAAIGVPSPHSAQANRVIRTHTSPVVATSWDNFGEQVIGMGRVNNDAHDDYAISAYGERSGGAGTDDAGTVRVYSGKDGTVLWSRTGTAGWLTCTGGTGTDRFGTEIARVPDVTGDNVDELLVGAPGTGVVTTGGCLEPRGAAYLLNGATGATLQTWFGANASEDFGASVASVAGRALILAPRGVSPRAQQYDPASGALFFNHPMANGELMVRSAGDFNGDGVAAEFMTASPFAAVPTVAVIDAVTGFPVGAPIVQPVPNAGSWFGYSVSVLPGAGTGGPFGVSDLILIGEPFYMSGAAISGRILAADFGVGGTTTFANGGPGDSLGWRVDAGGDLEGDGLPDVIALAIGSSRALFFTGQGGVPLALTGTPPGPIAPNTSFVGDVTNNGYDDLAFSYQTLANETVELISGGTSSVIFGNFGPGCARAPGGLSNLVQNGPPIPGSSISFTVSNLGGYDSVALFLGAPDAAGTVLVSGCTLYLQGVFQLAFVPTLGGATSWTSPSYNVPIDFNALGVTLGYQALALPLGGGSGQLATSNALTSTIGW